MGLLEAQRPLAMDVAHNAFAAGLRDPRFPPVTAFELGAVRLSISVLGPSEPLEAAGEAELLGALQPGVDGLILELAGRRATFLPAVWEQLSDPRDFLGHLRRKAGLPEDFWSAGLSFRRYRVESFQEEEGAPG